MTEPNNELVVGPWELSIHWAGGGELSITGQAGVGGAQYHCAGRGGEWGRDPQVLCAKIGYFRAEPEGGALIFAFWDVSGTLCR